jgi:hypothetical protein
MIPFLSIKYGKGICTPPRDALKRTLKLVEEMVLRMKKHQEIDRNQEIKRILRN